MGCLNPSAIALPKDILPGMLLPGLALFPHSLVPLFIFEERYRAMLEAALESDRHFCIAMPRDPELPPSCLQDLHPVGGAGVIRACVRNPDGTSHLILQGTVRVKFTSLDLSGPYPRFGLTPISATPGNSSTIRDLHQRIIDLISEGRQSHLPVTPQLEECLRALQDGDDVADLVAGAIVTDPLERLHLLEEPDTTRRLIRIRDYLERALSRA